MIKEFALSLYQSILSEQTDDLENIIFSPPTIYAGLCLTFTRCRSTSGKEIYKIVEDLLSGTFKQSSGMRVDVANKLFVDEAFLIKPNFLTISNSIYGGATEKVDFVKQMEVSRQKINNYVAGITGFKNKEILPPHSLHDDIKLVIANAIYFKGQWKMAFCDEFPVNQQFYLLDGSSISIPMMYQSCDCLYEVFDDLDATAISLPFVDDSSRIVIILPNQRNGLSKVLDGLFKRSTRGDDNAIAYLDICLCSTNYHTKHVGMSLPTFVASADSTISLAEQLKQLDEISIFDETTADLGGIPEVEKLHVSSFRHRAVLEVNKDGAKDDIADGVIKCFPGNYIYPVPFRVDHPFVVAITTEDGVPLMLGHITDPTKY